MEEGIILTKGKHNILPERPERPPPCLQGGPRPRGEGAPGAGGKDRLGHQEGKHRAAHCVAGRAGTCFYHGIDVRGKK